ncbi:MAG: sigma-70 family RNA polymerase sigma factor [Solirubrobacteraceae bacterium]
MAALRPSSPSRVFESLYRRHVADVYRYLLAMLDRQADAEDATQTTFLHAYRALERGERPRDAGSWLRAIALNVSREHYRRASRRPDEVSLNDDPGELVLDPPTPAIGDVIRGLSCLPFNQRAALVMREFEGRSLAEIAVALDVSDSAVEALLFRGRRALREQLEETLSCAQAEAAISSQLDGALPRSERGRLRAHLRECSDCASLARRLRGQRSAIRALSVVPLPAALKLSAFAAAGGASAAGPASTAAGGSLLSSAAASVAAKLAVATIVAVTAVGVGYASLHHQTSRPAASSRPASVAGSRPNPDKARGNLAGHGGRLSPAQGSARPAHAAASRPRRGTALRTHARRQSGSPTAASTPAPQAIAVGNRSNYRHHSAGPSTHGRRTSSTPPGASKLQTPHRSGNRLKAKPAPAKQPTPTKHVHQPPKPPTPSQGNGNAAHRPVH